MHSDERHMSAEAARLRQWQARLEERRRALAARSERADEHRAAVLQTEAAIVELQREVELREASLHDRRRAISDRRDALLAKEAEFAAQQTAAAADQRRVRATAEAQQADIESRWRALEESLTASNSRRVADEDRIKRLLADADERDAMLREKNRVLADREGQITAAERSLEHLQQQLGSLDASIVHRMRAELKEREALLGIAE